MSSLKDSEEQTSPPATPGSRGVHVASSHFSKIRASRGNNGCLQTKTQINIYDAPSPMLLLLGDKCAFFEIIIVPRNIN